MALVAAAAALALAGCPLPFEYTGGGAGSAHTVDPSSPGVTLPVTVSYAVQGGASGTISDGDSYTAGATTVVTLSTATNNAVIYYTDDGSAVSSYSTAKKFTGSSGSITLTKTTSVQTLDVRAVAIGPDMKPSQEISATVIVSPYPIVMIARSPAAIPEDGGTSATYTITSSVPPSSAITIGLAVSGTYETGDFSGTIPSFIQLPAGSSSVVVATITGQPDADSDDEDVTVTILPDPSPQMTYSVGAPSSATVTIQDNHKPVLTLSVDRTSMTDVQTATFTVTASFAAVSATTVNIGTTGYTSGTVNVPSTVTLAAGATTTTFTVTAASQAGYQEQNPKVSISAGTGYTVGSPASQNLQIVDDVVGAFTYDGVWTFETGTGTKVGTGVAWTLGSGNVSVSGGGITFGGVYPNDDAQANLSPTIDQSGFTLGVSFVDTDLSVSRPIIVAGYGYRWLMMDVDTSGNLTLELNNHTVHLATGFTITAGTTYNLVMTFDVTNLTVKVGLNGTTVSLALPAGFTWNNPTNDQILTAEDYSTGQAFKGTWYWVFLTNGLLTYGDVLTLIATDPKL